MPSGRRNLKCLRRCGAALRRATSKPTATGPHSASQSSPPLETVRYPQWHGLEGSGETMLPALFEDAFHVSGVKVAELQCNMEGTLRRDANSATAIHAHGVACPSEYPGNPNLLSPHGNAHSLEDPHSHSMIMCTSKKYTPIRWRGLPQRCMARRRLEFLLRWSRRRSRRRSRAKRAGQVPSTSPAVLPLSGEEQSVAEKWLQGDLNDELVVSRFSVDLTRRNLSCCRPKEWLNDEVINFYFKLLQERSDERLQGTQCWFANSFFWTALSGGDRGAYNFAAVRRWTIRARVDVFNLDYVAFPMNLHGTHWSVGVIDIRQRGFRYFDSLGTEPPLNFVPFLRRYVSDEHLSRRACQLDGVDKWDFIKYEGRVPYQQNCYDCGVFACFFADYFTASQKLTFCQADMPTLRIRLAARVASGDARWSLAY